MVRMFCCYTMYFLGFRSKPIHLITKHIIQFKGMLQIISHFLHFNFFSKFKSWHALLQRLRCLIDCTTWSRCVSNRIQHYKVVDCTVISNCCHCNLCLHQFVCICLALVTQYIKFSIDHKSWWQSPKLFNRSLQRWDGWLFPICLLMHNYPRTIS